MALRQPLTSTLQRPPEGTLKLTFWRHITSTPADADFFALHQNRSVLIHEFIRTASLEVRDWGGVDAERSSESVEILVELGTIVLTPLAAELAKFLVQHIKRRRNNKTDVLKGVTLTLPAGAEVVFEYRYAVTGKAAQAQAEAYLKDQIEQFLDGKSVPRVLRPDQV